ncbi:NAD(P)/FAD-dependent oxidoreductase [Aeromicrobium sp. CF4.19]|uniref:NAD(P)/FAD-dependent oxidoreductase n=1 Tax=Aeromicrobium sp. CF4.19 TaxID=3373082 RepID=UPI003EE43A33
MSDQTTYVIIGAGMTGDAAAKGIRAVDESADIVLVGEEPTSPVPRPALSKKLWTDPDFTLEDADLHTAEESGARLVLDARVDGLDLEDRVVTTSDGQRFPYDRLLIATGGHPTRVEGLEPGDRVVYFRTLTDYHQLRRLSRSAPYVAVVGGGFIGTEIAAALVQNGCTVSLHHPERTLNASKFPAPIAAAYEQRFLDAGVDVQGGSTVERGEDRDDRVRLTLDDGSTLDADAVVVGLGIEPAGDLAAAAGLQMAEDGGIVVDERLATSAPGVWAAGDVAQYPDVRLGRSRVEHVDNATTMGDVVGRIMAGDDQVYDHTPYFYSAVLGVRFEAVGTLDSSLETVIDERDSGSSVVLYLDDGAVAGVLLWDAEEEGGEDARDAARALIGEQGDAAELAARIPQ